MFRQTQGIGWLAIGLGLTACGNPSSTNGCALAESTLVTPRIESKLNNVTETVGGTPRPGYKYLGQTFQIQVGKTGDTFDASSVSLLLNNPGGYTPGIPLTVTIEENGSGTTPNYPSGTALATASVDAQALFVGEAVTTFVFAKPVTLARAKIYWLKLAAGYSSTGPVVTWVGSQNQSNYEFGQSYYLLQTSTATQWDSSEFGVLQDFYFIVNNPC